jgi:hypothetical protein
MRRSRSWISITWIERPITEDKAVISSGVNRPSPSSLQIAAMAASASSELFIGGIVTLIGCAFRGGKHRSSIMRWEETSPAKACSKIFWTSCSARPSTSCSRIWVVLFFEPGGRPGFPGGKGRPRTLRASVLIEASGNLAGRAPHLRDRLWSAFRPRHCSDVLTPDQFLVTSKFFFVSPEASDSRLPLLLEFGDDLGEALVFGWIKKRL